MLVSKQSLDRTPDRPLEIASFLDRHGWGNASPQPFDGDFSPRRYARLSGKTGTAILMDADPDQKTESFVQVAEILRQCKIAAPKIYAAEPAQGLVLLQDFGNRNIGSLIDRGEDARPFFLQAAALLATLHRAFIPAQVSGSALPHYTSALFTAQAELFLDSYFPYATQREATTEEREDFRAAWLTVLRPLDKMPQSLLLRDFMPDNLMDLGDDALGVLDFQDAGIGPVAYDLASLCEKVRRDGGFELLPNVIAAYSEQTPDAPPQTDLMRACTILSAQRHIRILGILANLVVQKGRRDKLDLIPRVRAHLEFILDEPSLLPVRVWMKSFKDKVA